MTKPLPIDVCHLYRITDVVRGKFYIGKHRGVQRAAYWGGGKRIKAHVKKHGFQDLKYEILVIADEKYIYDLEKKYVTEEFIKDNPNCLNLCRGGIGGNFGAQPWNKGKKWNDAAREKMRQAKLNKVSNRLGKKNSEEHNLKISLAHTGKTWITDAGRKKLSELNKGKVWERVDCPHCGKNVPWHMRNQKHFEKCDRKELNYA